MNGEVKLFYPLLFSAYGDEAWSIVNNIVEIANIAGLKDWIIVHSLEDFDPEIIQSLIDLIRHKLGEEKTLFGETYEIPGASSGTYGLVNNITIFSEKPDKETFYKETQIWNTVKNQNLTIERAVWINMSGKDFSDKIGSRPIRYFELHPEYPSGKKIEKDDFLKRVQSLVLALTFSPYVYKLVWESSSTYNTCGILLKTLPVNESYILLKNCIKKRYIEELLKESKENYEGINPEELIKKVGGKIEEIKLRPPILRIECWEKPEQIKKKVQKALGEIPAELEKVNNRLVKDFNPLIQHVDWEQSLAKLYKEKLGEKLYISNAEKLTESLLKKLKQERDNYTNRLKSWKTLGKETLPDDKYFIYPYKRNLIIAGIILFITVLIGLITKQSKLYYKLAVPLALGIAGFVTHLICKQFKNNIYQKVREAYKRASDFFNENQKNIINAIKLNNIQKIVYQLSVINGRLKDNEKSIQEERDNTQRVMDELKSSLPESLYKELKDLCQNVESNEFLHSLRLEHILNVDKFFEALNSKVEEKVSSMHGKINELITKNVGVTFEDIESKDLPPLYKGEIIEFKEIKVDVPIVKGIIKIFPIEGKMEGTR